MIQWNVRQRRYIMKKKDRYELAAGSRTTPAGQTLVSHVSFVTTPCRSSISAMAAAPWWIEHSPSSATLDWKRKPSTIDTTWKNVITWHCAAHTLGRRSTLMTKHSSLLLDTWLMPEALAGSEPSSFPTHSQTFPHVPNQSQHHLNLSPYHCKPQIIFSESSLAKALLTGPLPLLKTGSSPLPFLPPTMMVRGTKYPFAESVRHTDITRMGAQTLPATFV